MGREPEAKRLSARSVSRSHGKCPCGLRVRGQAGFSGPGCQVRCRCISIPASSCQLWKIPPARSHSAPVRVTPQFKPPPFPCSLLHTDTLSQAQKPPLVWPQAAWLIFFYFFFNFYPSIFAFRGFPGCDSWGRRKSDTTERLN